MCGDKKPRLIRRGSIHVVLPYSEMYIFLPAPTYDIHVGNGDNGGFSTTS